MTAVVLIGLAAVWAVVLIPGWVRALRERTGRRTTIDAFSDQLNVLGNGPAFDGTTPPGSRLRPLERRGRRPRSTIPMSAEDARQRRRDVIVILVAGAVVSLVGFIASGIVVVLIAHLMIDAALAGFVTLVVQRRKMEAERMAKVHYLQPPAGRGRDVKVARRSAN